MRKQKVTSINLAVLSFAVFVIGLSGSLAADEYYAGGVTVDIDYEIYGYLWVEDATVNLYENAHIINDAFYGDIYATSGAVINMYGGTVEGIFFVAPGSTAFADAQVTIYGTDFAIDGVPVEPTVTEVYLQNQQLSGMYVSGTEFSHLVDCSASGVTIKLAWILEEPTPAEQMEMIMAYYEMALEEGTIERVRFGRGRHRGFQRWQKKHDPFEKMLMIAQRFIDAEYYEYAAKVLAIVDKKCDGESRPHDLIAGEGVVVLNDMISELIETLNEQR